MLYSFIKYKHKYLLHINCRGSDKQHFIYLSGSCVNITPSTFGRKIFFRTLLFYVSIINSNFFHVPDFNYFYFTTFIYSRYSTNHPSFYYKHINIR